MNQSRFLLKSNLHLRLDPDSESGYASVNEQETIRAAVAVQRMGPNYHPLFSITLVYIITPVCAMVTIRMAFLTSLLIYFIIIAICM